MLRRKKLKLLGAVSVKSLEYELVKYLIPVFVDFSGHIKVEVPGKDTPENRNKAIRLAISKYDGVDSVTHLCSYFHHICEDPDDVELDDE